MEPEIRRTRDMVYRVDVPERIPSWISDQVDALAEGWIPLASDPQGDGWVRVTYEEVSSPSGTQGAGSITPGRDPSPPVSHETDAGTPPERSDAPL
jgi:hypothetical protein